MTEAFGGRHGYGCSYYLTLLGILWIVGTATIVSGDTGEAEDNISPGGADLSHGLGDHIDWHTLEKGQELAEKEGKPLMLIIHKTWCGACRCKRWI